MAGRDIKLQCVDCRKTTTMVEAQKRTFNRFHCAKCGGRLARPNSDKRGKHGNR